MKDPDPMVRAEAVAMLQAMPPDQRAERLMPLLGDPVRMVRIAAARQMLTVPPDALRPSQRALFREAMGEWQRSISNKLDFPETHMVMGGMALSTRNFPAAEAAFREAVRLDPQRVDSWSILIRLIHATRGVEEALGVLGEALERVPDAPVLLQLQAGMGG